MIQTWKIPEEEILFVWKWSLVVGGLNTKHLSMNQAPNDVQGLRDNADAFREGILTQCLETLPLPLPII